MGEGNPRLSGQLQDVTGNPGRFSHSALLSLLCDLHHQGCFLAHSGRGVTSHQETGKTRERVSCLLTKERS